MSGDAFVSMLGRVLGPAARTGHHLEAANGAEATATSARQLAESVRLQASRLGTQAGEPAAPDDPDAAADGALADAAAALTSRCKNSGADNLRAFGIHESAHNLLGRVGRATTPALAGSAAAVLGACVTARAALAELADRLLRGADWPLMASEDECGPERWSGTAASGALRALAALDAVERVAAATEGATAAMRRGAAPSGAAREGAWARLAAVPAAEEAMLALLDAGDAAPGAKGASNDGLYREGGGGDGAAGAGAGALLRPERPDLVCGCVVGVVERCCERAAACSAAGRGAGEPAGAGAGGVPLGGAEARRAVAALVSPMLAVTGSLLASMAAAGAGTTTPLVVADEAAAAASAVEAALRGEPAAAGASILEDGSAGPAPGGDAEAGAAGADEDAAAGAGPGLASRRRLASPSVVLLVHPLLAAEASRAAWLDAELRAAEGAASAARDTLSAAASDAAPAPGRSPAGAPAAPGPARVRWVRAHGSCSSAELLEAASAPSAAARRLRRLLLLLPDARTRTGVASRVSEAIAAALTADVDRVILPALAALPARVAPRSFASERDCPAAPALLPPPGPMSHPPPPLRLPAVVPAALALAASCRAAAAELRLPVDGTDPAALSRQCRAMEGSADALEAAVAAAIADVVCDTLVDAVLAAADSGLRPARPPAPGDDEAGASLPPHRPSEHERRLLERLVAGLGHQPRRHLLGCAAPLAAMAAAAAAPSLLSDACSRCAAAAAGITIGRCVVAACEGGSAAVVAAAHMAAAVAAAEVSPHAFREGCVASARAAGGLRLLGRAGQDDELAGVLSSLDGSLAAETAARSAREAQRAWEGRVSAKGWGRAMRTGLDGARLASAAWGQARGAAEREARSMLEARGFAGCSPAEVVAVARAVAEPRADAGEAASDKGS